MARLPDGRMVLGYLAAQGAGGLGCLNPDGTVDESFNPRLRAAGVDGFISDVAAAPDGRVLVGGRFTQIDGQPRHGLARLLPNGEVDPSFDPVGMPDGDVNRVAVQRNGKVLVTTMLRTSGGDPPTYRRFLARLNVDGHLDLTFNSGAVSGNAYPDYYGVTSLQVQGDGMILLSAAISDFDGLPRGALLRLYGDPILTLPMVEHTPSGLRWLIPTARDTRYTLEWTDSLAPTNWVALPPLVGHGSLQSLVDTNQIAPQRFYRLRVE